jgi:dipeptide transport system substrate-binding protein
VVFTLNKVDAAFIQNLAMSFAAILSAEYADTCWPRAGRATSTRNRSAPARSCSSATRRTQIRYKGNKDYWAPTR